MMDAVPAPDDYLQHGDSGALLYAIVLCFGFTLSLLTLTGRSLMHLLREGVRQLTSLSETGRHIGSELAEVRQEVRKLGDDQQRHTRGLRQHLDRQDQSLDQLLGGPRFPDFHLNGSEAEEE